MICGTHNHWFSLLMGLELGVMLGDEDSWKEVGHCGHGLEGSVSTICPLPLPHLIYITHICIIISSLNPSLCLLPELS